MTQKERMLAGQLYLVDEELAAEYRRTAGVLRQFNSEPEPEARAALLRGLLGGTGSGSSRPSAATTAAISIWAKTSMRIMSSSCSTSATSASATTSCSGRA